MYELIQVGEHSYYIQCPAKIGLVTLDDHRVVLIDSGSDKDAAKKVKKILDANGWSLATIYITHSHADHIGGNAYLQAQTGCAVYAPGIERDFTEHPILEPAFLYGGYPCKELRHKFLLAQESHVLPLTADVLPQGWEMVELPGHSFSMVGYRTQDDVLYTADCLSSEETLQKYGIPFLYDAEAFLQTLEMLKGTKAAVFVPSHAEVCEEIATLAQYNIDAVNGIADAIEEICAEPKSFEEILQALFCRYGLTMTWQQYVLVGSTVRSLLTWLKESGRVDVAFADARLLWNGTKG